MKITINENESYEINIPETMSGQEFFEWLSRMHRISKLMGQDFMTRLKKQKKEGKFETKDISEKTSHKNSQHSPFFSDRNAVIEMLKLYYKDVKKLEEHLTKKGIYLDNKTHLGKVLYYYRKKHNIKPQEVGMKEYPTPGRKAEDFFIK